jgi:hypothetical protein
MKSLWRTGSGKRRAFIPKIKKIYIFFLISVYNSIPGTGVLFLQSPLIPAKSTKNDVEVEIFEKTFLLVTPGGSK